jgi:DNA-binding winged helix-turn-helix (wHTH) protein
MIQPSDSGWPANRTMLDRHRQSVDNVVSFGNFRLCLAERLLQRDGAPVALGARALEILIALVRQAGEPMTKRDLMQQVWPNLTVDEGSLRFYISALRKALSDGEAGSRYIVTLSGRGYCFVAPVAWTRTSAAASRLVQTGPKPPSALPARLARMVGATSRCA